MAPKEVAYGPNEPVLSPTVTLRVLSRPLIDRPHCAGAQPRTMRLPARALVFAAVLLTACGSTLAPTASMVTLLVTSGFSTSPAPTPSLISGPTESSTALPTPVPAGLRVDGMARVTVDRLRQMADPEHPNDHALESPGSAGERRLLPLQAGTQVYIVGGPLVAAGIEYWQVADYPIPGCCAPFGWVRALTRSREVTIEPFETRCPDTSKPLASGEVARLDGLGQLACFGRTELQLRGALYCGRPTVDGPAFLTGTGWVMDQIMCNLDETFPVHGSAVTEFETETRLPRGLFRPLRSIRRPIFRGLPMDARQLSERCSRGGRPA